MNTLKEVSPETYEHLYGDSIWGLTTNTLNFVDFALPIVVQDDLFFY